VVVLLRKGLHVAGGALAELGLGVRVLLVERLLVFHGGEQRSRGEQGGEEQRDGDGVKNIDEIKAGTNPGDKNSK